LILPACIQIVKSVLGEADIKCTFVEWYYSSPHRRHVLWHPEQVADKLYDGKKMSLQLEESTDKPKMPSTELHTIFRWRFCC
jgi:hypothetical protein